MTKVDFTNWLHSELDAVFNREQTPEQMMLKAIPMIHELSSQNSGKPFVSGSLPQFDADGFKRWMSGWVEPNHISTIAAHVEKMLGGNNR